MQLKKEFDRQLAPTPVTTAAIREYCVLNRPSIASAIPFKRKPIAATNGGYQRSFINPSTGWTIAPAAKDAANKRAAESALKPCPHKNGTKKNMPPPASPESNHAALINLKKGVLRASRRETFRS